MTRMQQRNNRLEYLTPQQNAPCSGHSDPRYRHFVFLTVSVAFLVYLVGVSSFPATILMGQEFDDALYIRLGLNIANGNWLGTYNELTLVKAPMFPVFLAAFSFTGIPFNIAQHCLFFLGCIYLANIASHVCKSKAVGIFLFAAVVTCPSYYTITRVIRDPLYTTLTLFLVGSWIELFLLDRLRGARLSFAAMVGTLSAAYWLTREEGIWILPCLGIITLGGFVRSLAGGSAERSKRGWSVSSYLLVVLLFASATAVGVGLLNKMTYGRFVLVEMGEGNFQRALVALQRVGEPYNRPYLPLPREARQLVYAESPSFAKLKDFLDPPDHSSRWINAACRPLPSTCGDIGGGWFLWALRDVLSKSGMYETPEKAAAFYRSIANEVEAACGSGRLKCSAWLPPLVPAIPATQWTKLPNTLLKTVGLLLNFPPPKPPDIRPSDLTSRDGAEALEFLNRPYHVLEGEENPPQTKSKLLVKDASLALLRIATKIDSILIALGILSLLLALVFWPRRAMGSGIFIIIVALTVAVLSRCFLIALIHISAFPAIFHDRMLPAEPLAISSAVLSIYLFSTLAWRRKPAHRQSA